MLIKKRKLVSVNGGRSIAGILQSEHGEVSKALQLEIQKVKQEARQVKHEAQLILAESEQKLKEAESKAKQIISNTNLEAKAIKEKVYKETIQAANKEAELIKEQAKGLLRELFEVKREALTQANKEIIKVALDLAEKIIRYKVSVDPNVLQVQVVEAIKKATSEADRIQVFVNPNDLKALEENTPQIEKLFPAGIDIVPLASDSVDLGSCIIETKSGQLDARFSTQLQTLTDLIGHIEIVKARLEINEVMPEEVLQQGVSRETASIQETSFVEIKEVEDEDDLPEAEKEILEKEILADNPFPFVSNEQSISPALPLELENVEDSHVVKQDLLQEQEVINIPEEIIRSFEEQSLEENQIQPPVNIQQKKRLSIGPLSERTKEEAEELDEGLVFETEDIEEEKEEVKPQNILKPKKSKPSEVSNIASELEENPEWKDLVEEDEE